MGHTAIRDLVNHIKLNAKNYRKSESEKEKDELYNLISTDLNYLAQI